MKKVLVPLADGFEEIEATSIIDILRRAGVEVLVAGIKKGEMVGARKIRITPDAVLNAVKDEDFDAIVLPGGQPGVDNLRKSPDLLEIVRRMNDQQKIIGAICAAPVILKDAGLTQDLKMTCYPGFEGELVGAQFKTDRIVIDGRIITSRGPGTAIEFALKLVELLCNKEKAEQLSEGLLARR